MSSASLNSRAWLRPFWPVVASMTSTTVTGMVARLRETLTTLASSRMSSGLVCRRPAVSMSTSSVPSRLGLLEHVVADARRVGAALARDDLDARALAPHLQLLDGGGTEGVGAADEAAHAQLVVGVGKLAHRGGLAGAVDAHEEHARRQAGERVALGAREHLGEALRQRLAQLARRAQVLAGGLLAQVVGHLHGDLGAHVAHDERVLEVLPELLVDLAAHVEDLGDGLARAREALLEVVKQGHQASTTFPVARSRRWLTTWLTPSACIETP